MLKRVQRQQIKTGKPNPNVPQPKAPEKTKGVSINNLSKYSKVFNVNNKLQQSTS